MTASRMTPTIPTVCGSCLPSWSLAFSRVAPWVTPTAAPTAATKAVRMTARPTAAIQPKNAAPQLMPTCRRPRALPATTRGSSTYAGWPVATVPARLSSSGDAYSRVVSVRIGRVPSVVPSPVCSERSGPSCVVRSSSARNRARSSSVARRSMPERPSVSSVLTTASFGAGRASGCAGPWCIVVPTRAGRRSCTRGVRGSGTMGRMTTSGESEQRVGNAERDAAVTALNEHWQAGRLDPAEHERRTTAAYAAVTRADLDALFADLPGGGPAARTAVAPAPLEGRLVNPPYEGSPSQIEPQSGSGLFPPVAGIALYSGDDRRKRRKQGDE